MENVDRLAHNRELLDTLCRQTLPAVRRLNELGFLVEAVKSYKEATVILLASDVIPNNNLKFVQRTKFGNQRWMEAELEPRVKAVYQAA